MGYTLNDYKERTDFFMRLAYIRVSTAEQDFDRQMQVFKDAGIQFDRKPYEEKQSGKNIDDRPVLTALLNETLRGGDILYITEFSRLARSVRDLLNIVDMLNEKGVTLVSIKEKLDTNTSHGRMILTILGAVAEFERNIIRERQAEGIRSAKEKGVYTGRKKIVRKDFPFWYRKWLSREITAKSFSNVLKVSRNTLYRMIKEYEINHNIDRNTAERIDYDNEKEENEVAIFLDEQSVPK